MRCGPQGVDQCDGMVDEGLAALGADEAAVDDGAVVSATDCFVCGNVRARAHQLHDKCLDGLAPGLHADAVVGNFAESEHGVLSRSPWLGLSWVGLAWVGLA